MDAVIQSRNIAPLTLASATSTLKVYKGLLGDSVTYILPSTTVVLRISDQVALLRRTAHGSTIELGFSVTSRIQRVVNGQDQIHLIRIASRLYTVNNVEIEYAKLSELPIYCRPVDKYKYQSEVLLDHDSFNDVDWVLPVYPDSIGGVSFCG